MDRKRNEIARSLSMVTQLGISMLAPLILCVCVGIWLDDTFGWSTTAVLVVLGIMAGAQNTWMLAQQVGLPRQKRRKKDEKTGEHLDEPVPVMDDAMAALRYGVEGWRKAKRWLV